MDVRPFYFTTVVWGEEFRNYFLEYCLPSLLSPKNIPSLDGQRPAKYLLATTIEDWEAMKATAIFAELEKYADPIFLELPPREDRPYWYHAILGHKLCCNMAVSDKAYRILACPDTVFSDGAVKRFHEVALDGAEVVLSLTSPLTRTDLFIKTLGEIGLLPERSARDTGIPIIMSPRQTVELAMHAMHGLSRVNEWDASYFCGYVATPWWRVPDELGAVISGPCWDLYLIDYNRAKHDGSILDTRGFDGDYVMRATGNLETIYLVRDSDEFHVVSWASLPEPVLRKHRYGDFGKGVEFRKSAYGSGFNEMQRDLLFMPKYVHTRPLSKKWDAVEARALRTLLTWLDPPGDVERYSRRLPPNRRNFAGLREMIASCHLPWWRRNARVWAAYRCSLLPIAASCFELPMRSKALRERVVEALRRIRLALRGDSAANQWLRWRGRKALAQAFHRPFDEPRPELSNKTTDQ